MLSDSDTDTVKTWLKASLQLAARHGLSKVGLAAVCEVTPQAVDGWVRTGRITKRNLELAAQYFGVAPSFTASSLSAREPARPALTPWPFKLVLFAEIARLPKRKLDRLDRMIRDRVNEWAEDDAAAKRKAA